MTPAPQYMLDTNICIYIQRQLPEAVLDRFRVLPPGQTVISAVTWGELLYGAAKSQRPVATRRILADFAALVPVAPLPPEAGKMYGSVRAGLEKAGTPIGNNDLWIAAHAMAAGLTLVTNNVREFARITALRVENWV